MLAVDPATGAMFNIVPTKVQHSLAAADGSVAQPTGAAAMGSTH
jgi:hypothetical protein